MAKTSGRNPGGITGLNRKRKLKKELESKQEQIDLRESNTRPPLIETGSKEHTKYIQELRHGVEATDNDFVRYLALAEVPPKDPDKSFERNEQMYNQRLMIQCVSPLSRGVDADSIVQCIGMMAGMALLSKGFRKTCKNAVADVMYPKIAEKAEKFGEGSKYARRRDDILRANNEGLLPLSPKVAALTKIGFIQKTYDDMRKPGANVDEIERNYNLAMGALADRMDKDGVSMEDVNRNERIIIGQFAKEDPSILRMFNETAFGDVKVSKSHKEATTTMGENGVEIKSENVWRGEFEKEDGSSFMAGFSPRRPISGQDYSDRMAGKMKSVFVKAGKDINEMSKTAEAEGRVVTAEDDAVHMDKAYDDLTAYTRKVEMCAKDDLLVSKDSAVADEAIRKTWEHISHRTFDMNSSPEPTVEKEDDFDNRPNADSDSKPVNERREARRKATKEGKYDASKNDDLLTREQEIDLDRQMGLY